jgi:hypothetical protein
MLDCFSYIMKNGREFWGRPFVVREYYRRGRRAVPVRDWDDSMLRADMSRGVEENKLIVRQNRLEGIL